MNSSPIPRFPMSGAPAAAPPPWLLRWQTHEVLALAGGSLIAAQFTISALMALAVARSAMPQTAATHCVDKPHG